MPHSTGPQTRRPVATPPCVICERTTSVRHLACRADGLNCWTCDDCLVSWTTESDPKWTVSIEVRTNQP